MNAAAKAQLERKLTNGLVFIARSLTRDARKLATKNLDQGQRRNAITHKVQPNGSVIWGIPDRAAPHALFLDRGYVPHFVPAKYLGAWPRRHGLGNPSGIFAGGPNSTLQYGGSAARGKLGGKMQSWQTKGGRSEYLPDGKVGSPAVVPAYRELTAAQRRAAFIKGYKVKA